MIRQVKTALDLTFRGPGSRRAFAILGGAGTAATTFYLFMLPSPAVGGLSPIALRYLTPFLAIAAVTLGFGFALAIAINVGALAQRRASAEIVGIGGLLASVLPGSLCCTSVVPSLLALLGLSSTSIIGTTGRIQSIFVLHENEFIVASVAAVLLSVYLAARNRTAGCKI
ncbi:MAG: hypothetical protein NVSMB64_04210 [Candidatus Velthaea sp.]